MTIAEIKEIIENGEYGYYGIRSDEVIEYNVGDICYASHQWWQDDPEDNTIEYNETMQCWDGGELSGTCALRVTEDSDIQKIIDFSRRHYGGKHITLIAGDRSEYGYDDGEIIIRDAKVLCIL
jgi:hypothetical protein